MSELQKEIYGYSKHFRARKEKKFLSEVQKRQSEAERLHVYCKDKSEKLTAGRRSFKQGKAE
jgi:hypothetical protein